MPERNENYMNKIKKLCGFCINEWHLTTMILPYISKEIENNYKMITILENSIEENIKTLIKKLNLKNHNFYDTKQNFQHHQIIQLLPFFLI